MDLGKERRKAAKYYNQGFRSNPNIVTPVTEKCGEICDTCNCHVFHQYTLKITNGKRDALHQHLVDKGIPNAIYYPVALHKQKAYQDERYKEEDFEVTNELVKNVISLPMHTELEKEQQDLIINTILDFIQ